MKRAIWIWSALAAQALALAGCGGFSELKFDLRSPPPREVSIRFDKILMHEAIAVGVIAWPYEGDELMDAKTKVVLESKNPAILGVGPSQPNTSEEDRGASAWTFVIFGASEGTTEVAVRIDDELEVHIPATVLPQ